MPGSACAVLDLRILPAPLRVRKCDQTEAAGGSGVVVREVAGVEGEVCEIGVQRALRNGCERGYCDREGGVGAKAWLAPAMLAEVNP